jgi:co-chaperonin GroES (HSP10)
MEELRDAANDVLVDSGLVVALATVHAQRTKSRAISEMHVWRVKNGRAVQFREYQGDEQRKDRFWS